MEELRIENCNIEPLVTRELLKVLCGHELDLKEQPKLLKVNNSRTRRTGINIRPDKQLTTEIANNQQVKG